jgi:anti-anti-sigma factor
MTFNIEKNGSELIIRVVESINTQTAPQFEKEVGDNLEGIINLIFDFKEVDYVSSAKLRVLLKYDNLMDGKGTLKVINVCSDVKEVFDMTGFSSILTLE